MDPSADELRTAVEAKHSCKATLFYVASVINTFRLGWDGRVHVFDLEGNPTARTAYAWCFPADGSRERQIHAVLDAAGLRGPYDAVQVAVSSGRH